MTSIKLIGKKNGKAKADVSMSYEDNRTVALLNNNSDEKIYGAYSVLTYDSDWNVVKVDNYLLNDGDGYGKGEQKLISWDNKTVVVFDLVNECGTLGFGML